jgi:hypothetical protein
LSVAGNELRVTIPEVWLSEAKYPVIVDPVIGTATVGSQYLWEQDPGEWAPLTNEVCIPVNRFLIADAIKGTCTAYFYVYSGEEYDSAGYPVLYADKIGKPGNRLSGDERLIDFAVGGAKGAGWRGGTFEGSGAAGDYVWFGAFTLYFWYARFDYGGSFYNSYWADETIPANYPAIYDAAKNFKLSMYVSYTGEPQAYVRTLVQGVTLRDAWKTAGTFRRGIAHTVKGAAVLSRFVLFPRRCLETAGNRGGVRAVFTFFRLVYERAQAVTAVLRGKGYARTCGETIRPGGNAKRSKGYYRRVFEEAGGYDARYYRALFLRSLPETSGLRDSTSHWGVYIRGLRVEAANMAETRHSGEYYRKHADTVRAAGIPLRSLMIFARLLTTAFIRDFLLRRFLIAREELVIKSKVTREVILESCL